MEESKNMVSSRHNRTDTHMNSETVGACTGPISFKTEGVPELRGEVNTDFSTNNLSAIHITDKGKFSFFRWSLIGHINQTQCKPHAREYLASTKWTWGYFYRLCLLLLWNFFVSLVFCFLLVCGGILYVCVSWYFLMVIICFLDREREKECKVGWEGRWGWYGSD